MCAKKDDKQDSSEVTEDLLIGYKGYARKILEAANAKVWDVVEIAKGKEITKGIILPRSEFQKETNFVNIKLTNGYNVGIELTDSVKIAVFSKEIGDYKLPETEAPFNEKLPIISLIGTGGTIASRLDYRTGAVHPAFTPSELFTAIPELATICNLRPEVVFTAVSEDLNPEYWMKLAKVIYDRIKDENVDGIVIGHGTDTLCFTGTALSLLLQNLTVPIILVGSQRSSDRPSSDSAMNLIHAVTAASKADLAEVLILMMGTSDHSYGLLHRPGLARKMHSSRRDAFKTVGAIPFGKVEGNEITIYAENYNKRDKNRDLKPPGKMESKVALVYHYPGIQPDQIENLIANKYKGIVIAGTGLGHISKNLLEPIKQAIEEKIVVVMAVQTLWGFTGMQVYERGREELAIGMIPGRYMLPETAYVKLCWALGQSNNPEEVKKLIQTNIAGELLERETAQGYLIYQGIETETK